MAVTIKSAKEIELMMESGKILAEVLERLEEFIKPGISTLDIDKEGERIMRSYNTIPSFLNYQGYPASICVSVNDQVVHGIPNKHRILEEGDIVSLDAGVIYQGYHSDAARTYGVGEISEEARLLIERTKQSFFEGIKYAKAGCHLFEISGAIDDYISQFGYGIVRDLVGHGIGKNLHDLPLIAEKSGREDYLLRIEDLDQLEFMLDDWISKIPEPQPIEQGEVLFDNFRLKAYKLKPGKNVKVISTAEEITFDILNTYKKTPVNVEFKAASATFQSDNKKTAIPVKLTPEVGVIQIPGMHSKTTDCGFTPKTEIKGKGILKVQFVANVNGLDKQFDYAFDIEGKTASELLFEKIFWPLLILGIIILIIVAYIIIKKFMPVKVTMEIVGKPSLKFKTVPAN